MISALLIFVHVSEQRLIVFGKLSHRNKGRISTRRFNRTSYHTLNGFAIMLIYPALWFNSTFNDAAVGYSANIHMNRKSTPLSDFMINTPYTYYVRGKTKGRRENMSVPASVSVAGSGVSRKAPGIVRRRIRRRF